METALPLFNTDPKIQLVPIPGHTPIVVIDNFVQEPEALVAYASGLQGKFSIAPKNAFPGLEMRMPDEFSARLNDFFIQHVRKHLGARRSLSMYSRLSMVTLQPHELAPNQSVCHQDQLPGYGQHCFSASVLYLFNNPAMGGTSFYVPKVAESEIVRLYSSPAQWQDVMDEKHIKLFGSKPNYMTRSNDYFDLVCTIPAAWNRVIFYDGCIFHSGHITAPELLSLDPAKGRLTINGFFTSRKSAGAGT
ncbi:MAG TPA: DUF6445 family protein [Burkholderiaceae bacterium]